jgi:hypothetical protein
LESCFRQVTGIIGRETFETIDVQLSLDSMEFDALASSLVRLCRGNDEACPSKMIVLCESNFAGHSFGEIMVRSSKCKHNLVPSGTTMHFG